MAIDVAQRAPAWVRYADYIGGGSDKFYEVRVDEEAGAWLLTKRYGPWPDSGKGGQIRQESFSTQALATEAGRKVFQSKLGKGYDENVWPFGPAPMPDLNDPKAVEAWLSS